MHDDRTPRKVGDSRRLVKTREPGVYKRGGRYVVVSRAGGRQVKRFAKTLAEARAMKASLRADVARGDYREESRLTFAEYASQWLDTYHGRTDRGIRPATLADYRRTMERDAIPFLGRLRLREVEPRHIKQYRERVASRGVSPNTVRLALAPVRALFATALEEGAVRSNPTVGVRVAGRVAVDADADRPKALTEDELARILGNVPDRWRLVLELLAQTGLRIGELVALQWQHIDFGRRRILVRRRYYRGAFAPPKSRYGRRDVPISEAMARRLWDKRKAARDAREEALVFPSQTGEPLNSANLFSRVLKPGRTAAGIEWAGFHTFRHTCATMLFKRGLNAKQVQVWLGHHSPAFTLEAYVHLLSDDLPETPFGDAESTTVRPTGVTAPPTAAIT